MLLLLCLVLVIIPIVIFFIKKQIYKKYKFLTSLIFVIIVLISLFIIISFILPHNDVSSEDRVLLENYIFDNYGLELNVTESEIIHRGNIGINPGIEYIFVLKNSNGLEYHLSINELAEIDLKTILSENPKLVLIQIK